MQLWGFLRSSGRAARGAPNIARLQDLFPPKRQLASSAVTTLQQLKDPRVWLGKKEIVVAPPDLAALEEERRARYPERREPLWKADLPAAQNGIVVLGAPLGTPEFVEFEQRMAH